MQIKSPKFVIDDLVTVHNYRSHAKNGFQMWEHGAVIGATYDLRGKDWQYRVMLARMSNSNRRIFVSVTDNGIKKRSKIT